MHAGRDIRTILIELGFDRSADTRFYSFLTPSFALVVHLLLDPIILYSYTRVLMDAFLSFPCRFHARNSLKEDIEHLQEQLKKE